MQGVKEVASSMADDQVARGKGPRKIGKRKSTQQIPDERICWRVLSAQSNIGSVSFYPLESGRTRIILWMNTTPVVWRRLSPPVGIVTIGVAGDLSVQEFIESRYDETGARHA